MATLLQRKLPPEIITLEARRGGGSQTDVSLLLLGCVYDLR